MTRINGNNEKIDLAFKKAVNGTISSTPIGKQFEIFTYCAKQAFGLAD